MSSSGGRILALAVLTALISTYPLLIGRSVHSPLMGGVSMLYDVWPYAPGTPAEALENPRAVDMLAPLTSTLPESAIERRALLSGEWPLWNRDSALGRPLWGQGQPGVLDPLHLLSLLPSNPATGADLKVVAARVVFTIGIGLVGWELGGAYAACAIAVIAPFSGVFLERLAHPAQFSLVYAPWLLLGYLIAARAVTPRVPLGGFALVWAASGLLVVASPAKEAAAQAILLHAAGVALVATTRRCSLACAATLVGGLVLVACVTAPHWLIFLDTWRRAMTAYDAPAVTFAGWRELVGLMLGPVMPGQPTPSLNILAVTFAVLAVWHASRRRRPYATALAAVAGLATLLAIGIIPARWLVALPLVGNLQRVGSLLLTAILVLLLALAAVALGATERRRHAVAAAILVVGFCACGAVMARDSFVKSPRMAAAAFATLLVGASAPVVLATPVGNARRVALAVIVVLVLAPGGLHVPFGITVLDQILTQPPHRTNYRSRSAAIEEWRGSMPAPYRVAGVDGVFRGGTQGLYDLEGVLGHDALKLPQFDQLMSSLGATWHRHEWDRQLFSTELDRTEGVLDMFGVRLLVAPPNSPFGVRAAGEPLRLVERPTAWPRAFFVGAVSSYATLQDFVRRVAVAHGPFASIDAADMDARTAMQPFLGAIASAPVPATEYRLTTNETTFHLDAPNRGVVVLSEAWVAEDFEARLNGERVPYFRVNHLAKGIVIPAAGTWEVSFRYRPRLWRLSWCLAAAGALGLVLLVVMERRRP